MNVLLQLLDDGRLTDGRGRVVDFRNTLVIMTSNLCQGVEYEMQPGDTGTEARLLEGLGGHFRPELLNRLDGIVRFNALGREQVARIVRLELDKVARSLREQEIGLEVTDAAVARLAERGFDPVFGARPVKRVIQREVQDRAADLILGGDIGPDSVMVLDLVGDGLMVRVVR